MSKWGIIGAQLASLAVICYGLWLIFEPAAYIAAGVLTIVVAELHDLRTRNKAED